MGLELVEFIMEIEKRFDLDIPDDDVTFRTTRGMIDYLTHRLNAHPFGTPCRSQRVFYRVRSALMAADVPRARVTPSARLDVLLSRTAWSRVRRDIGYAGTPLWRRRRTVRDLVNVIVGSPPSPQTTREQPWPRDAVKQVVYEIAAREWGIEDFSEDADWHRDLKLG